MIFKDYSGYVFLLEFLTLAYSAGAKEVHEISNLFRAEDMQASFFIASTHLFFALYFSHACYSGCFEQ